MANLIASDFSDSSTPKRRYKLREASLTDVGGGRKENQDAFGIAHSANTSLYIVADGMGGAQGGTLASALAVNIIANSAMDEDGKLTEQSLARAVQRANDVVHCQSRINEDLKGMGTTIVVLAFTEERTIIAHLGDSRIYRLRNGELLQLTRDHTLIQELVDSGVISEDQLENHPSSHVLSRSLGPNESPDLAIQTLSEPSRKGDRFLLCSDGLHGFVAASAIQECLATMGPEAAAKELVDSALKNKGSDNITVEIIDVLGIRKHSSLGKMYPENGQLQLTLSEGIVIDNLQEIIAQADSLIEEAREQAAIEEQSAAVPAVDSREIEQVEEKPDSQSVPEDIDQPFVDSVPGQRYPAVHAAGFFLCGLFCGVIGLSVVQNISKSPEDLVVVQRNTESGEQISNESSEIKLAANVSQPEEVVQVEPKEEEQQAPEAETSSDTKSAAGDSEPQKVQENRGKQEAAGLESKWVGQALAELKVRDQEVLSGTDVRRRGFGNSSRLGDNVASLSVEKTRLRDRVADLRAKLLVLNLDDEMEAKDRRTRLTAQRKVLSDALKTSVQESEQRDRELSLWLKYKERATGKRALVLAKALEKYDPKMVEARETHEKASQDYVESLDSWSADPTNLKLSKEMSSKGKELRDAKNSLQQVVVDTIDRSVTIRARGLAELYVKKEAYERDLMHLAQQDAYLQEFAQLASSGSSEMKQNLLGRQRDLLNQLESLEGQVTRREEVAYSLQKLEKMLSRQ